MSESSEALAPPVPESSPDRASILDAVRESLRGGHRDFTQGSLGRAIVVLAIPMVLETFMESVFAICDVFFVSRLGADAIATVGLTESLITTIYAVAIGLSIGATATPGRPANTSATCAPLQIRVGVPEASASSGARPHA